MVVPASISGPGRERPDIVPAELQLELVGGLGAGTSHPRGSVPPPVMEGYVPHPPASRIQSDSGQRCAGYDQADAGHFRMAYVEGSTGCG